MTHDETILGISGVVRYLPDGSVSMVVKVPVRYTTCAAFGGEDPGDPGPRKKYPCGLGELKLMSQQNTHTPPSSGYIRHHQTIETGQVFEPTRQSLLLQHLQPGSTIQFLDPHLMRSRQVNGFLLVVTVTGAFSGHADALHH